MLILLVEDDEDLGRELAGVLRHEGHDVVWEKTGAEGLYRAREWEYDLVILDRMLPGMDGLQVLAKLRRHKSIPVMMLTALGSTQHRVEGLDGGADDYMGKPFELEELLARIRALSRRPGNVSGPRLTWRDITLDTTSHMLSRAGKTIPLTHNEYATVEFLLMRKGRPIPAATLEDRINLDDREFRSNAVEVLIHRIRQKVGKDFIKTRRGFGYMVPDSPEAM